jgi:hypothetical protein
MGAGPSRDLVYSEADVADMRERWQQAAAEQGFTRQLAELSGLVTAMPEQMRSIARSVALEVVLEQRKNDRSIRWERWPIIITLSLNSIGLLIEAAVLVSRSHP